MSSPRLTRRSPMGTPYSSYPDCVRPFDLPLVPQPLPEAGIDLAGAAGPAAVGARPALLPGPALPPGPPVCRASGGGAGAFAFADSHAGGRKAGAAGGARGASNHAALLDDFDPRVEATCEASCETPLSRGYGQGDGGRAGAGALAARAGMNEYWLPGADPMGGPPTPTKAGRGAPV